MMLVKSSLHRTGLATRVRRDLAKATSGPVQGVKCQARSAVRVSAAKPDTATSISAIANDVVVRDDERRTLQQGVPVTADLVDDHKTLFQSLLKEYAYWVDKSWVTGTIPPELCGTYYRNGPGLQISNPRYRRHTFDGDGMVLSLSFKNGNAYFRNRFVRTEGFVKEQAAGRPLFRNSFTRGAADGSLFFNPLDLNFKNVANTGVLKWAGELYAMWEGGLPYSMDPTSLETRGETRMGGALKGKTFAAHYRVVYEQGQPVAGASAGQAGQAGHGAGRRWVGFSMDNGFSGASATFYEFAEDGRLLHETTEKLEGESMAFVHDMLVTEHYYVLLLGPVEFDGSKFLTSYMLSRCSIAECLVYNPAKPSKILLVPRPGRPSGKVLRTKVLLAAPSFNFHHVNAFEEEAAATSATAEPLVVLDTIAMDSISFTQNQYTYGPDYYIGGQRSHLVRLICNPATGAVTSHRLLRRTLEFPATDPRVVGRTHTQVWAGCDVVDDDLYWGPFQAIVRADVDPRLGLPGGPSSSSSSSSTAAARPSPLSYGGVTIGGDGGGPESAFEGPHGTAAGVAADIWCAGERRFVGEPMFVPRPGSSREGDGWLIAAVHDAETQKGEVVILDAQDLAAGPIATINLPHRLPAGLHGSWDATFNGPEGTAEGRSSEPRWKEVGTIRAL